jgi:hypothetical protein
MTLGQRIRHDSGMVAGMTVCDGSHSVEYLLPWRHANPARESRHLWRDSLAGL